MKPLAGASTGGSGFPGDLGSTGRSISTLVVTLFLSKWLFCMKCLEDGPEYRWMNCIFFPDMT